jgi:hypothetical protein
LTLPAGLAMRGQRRIARSGSGGFGSGHGRSASVATLEPILAHADRSD